MRRLRAPWAVATAERDHAARTADTRNGLPLQIVRSWGAATRRPRRRRPPPGRRRLADEDVAAAVGDELDAAGLHAGLDPAADRDRPERVGRLLGRPRRTIGQHGQVGVARAGRSSPLSSGRRRAPSTGSARSPRCGGRWIAHVRSRPRRHRTPPRRPAAPTSRTPAVRRVADRLTVIGRRADAPRFPRPSPRWTGRPGGCPPGRRIDRAASGGRDHVSSVRCGSASTYRTPRGPGCGRPAFGTLTPMFGSSGDQYDRLSSNTGWAAWPRM